MLTFAQSLSTGKERDSRTSYYRARYYEPSVGRFLTEDPTRFQAGNNFYTYTQNNPADFRDPTGMDIAVIENGPTKGKPIGHTAIAITGYGVYSFGNLTDCGSSLASYLLREAPRRNTVVYIIKTTPAQDAAALAELQKWAPCNRTLPILTGNCSYISNQALTAAGIPSLPLVWGGDTHPGILPEFTPGSPSLRAGDGNRVSIPQDSTVIPGSLSQFEPRR